jgi:5-methylcytosine-specific restriction enzyme A
MIAIMPTLPRTHRSYSPLRPSQAATPRLAPSRRGYGWAWAKPGGIRDAHLRAHPLCVLCNDRGLTVAAAHVDHVDGDSSNNDSTNLQSLCASCHSKKTVRENGGFGFVRS